MSNFAIRELSTEAAAELSASFLSRPGVTSIELSGGLNIIFSHSQETLIRFIPTQEKTLAFFNRAFFKELA